MFSNSAIAIKFVFLACAAREKINTVRRAAMQNLNQKVYIDLYNILLINNHIFN